MPVDLAFDIEPSDDADSQAPGFQSAMDVAFAESHAPGINFRLDVAFAESQGSGTGFRLDARSAESQGSGIDFVLDPSVGIRFSSIRIVTLTLPPGQVGVVYSVPISATGGTNLGYAWSVLYGAVPPGLVLGAAGTPTTTLSGTPTLDGTFTFTVLVVDSNGSADDQSYVVVITVLVVLTFVVQPGTDTIRGGAEVFIASDFVCVDTTRDRTFTGLALPVSWVETTAGSGQVRYTKDGVCCDTRMTAGSTAGLSSTDSYLHFDASIDVALRFPEASTVPVDLAVLEATTASGATARVSLRRGVGQNPALTAAFGSLTLASGQVITGGILIVDPKKDWTLSVVRNGAFVAGFVGVRGADGRFTEQHQILGSDRFAIDAGTVRFRVENITFSGRVETSFDNFTVRPHVIIDGQLMVGKFIMSPRRILGMVPATTLARLGFCDVTTFGIFGSVTNVNGFEYTLPPPKTTGRLPAMFLRTYQDAQLSDGEEE